ADDLHDPPVLAQCGAGGASERRLLVELRGGADQTGERLEVPELQIRRLTEEPVQVRSELGEIDPGRIPEISASAQSQVAPGLLSLPEPLHHGFRLPFDRLRERRVTGSGNGG